MAPEQALSREKGCDPGEGGEGADSERLLASPVPATRPERPRPHPGAQLRREGCAPHPQAQHPTAQLRGEGELLARRRPSRRDHETMSRGTTDTQGAPPGETRCLPHPKGGTRALGQCRSI